MGNTERKVKKSYLDAFVVRCSIFKSAEDFENFFKGRNCPVSDFFFVGHGDLGSRVAREQNKGYLTISGSKEEMEEDYIKTVYSVNSIIFQLCWGSVWDEAVKMSGKISLGRAPNSDICLQHLSVSKLHGFFNLKDKDAVYTDASRFGTTIDKIFLLNNTLTVSSNAGFKIGPYEFTLFSAHDFFNRIVRIYHE